MILLRLNGDKVVGVYENISPTYSPKENEVIIDVLPSVTVNENEHAYLYYRDGVVEVEKIALNRV